ncbi:MAG: 50S ribosomal protein L30, partial [Thermoanaerobaculales bacterium]
AAKPKAAAKPKEAAIPKTSPAAKTPAKPAAKSASQAKKMLRITQLKSQIGFAGKQRRVLAGLGLGRIGSSVTRLDDPCIRGMVAKVTHLVSVEELEG